ncbi:MAG TPA: RNA polymerase sigma factor [Terriglobales bacterium]|nr:RNA polymerase sigma factor [Terriglobales bacterium]
MLATDVPIGTEPRSISWAFERDSEEVNDIFSRCVPSLYRTAYRRLGNAADAEDAVQDALLSAYKHFGEFRGEASVSTWLNAIVVNSARMQLRKRPRHIHLSLQEPYGGQEDVLVADRISDSSPSPEDECRRSELRARVLGLMEHLSPTLRKAFQLRKVDGLSIREAAQILGVADGTVKAQVARAAAKLRQLMRVRYTAPSTRDRRRRSSGQNTGGVRKSLCCRYPSMEHCAELR